ncbi:MAG TPA: DUF433 domain-containing protein [Tepidisphaeraceae bacterium]|jgi:uncharacterized protein (DUF433 family)
MDWRQWIERRPGVLAGKPVFKGTRLSVEFVLERLSDGSTEADMLNAYPTLRPEHIRAALACAAVAVHASPTLVDAATG